MNENDKIDLVLSIFQSYGEPQSESDVLVRIKASKIGYNPSDVEVQSIIDKMRNEDLLYFRGNEIYLSLKSRDIINSNVNYSGHLNRLKRKSISELLTQNIITIIVSIITAMTTYFVMQLFI